MRRERRAAPLWLRVVAVLVIAAFGLGAAWQITMLGRTLFTTWQARLWQAVPAQLHAWHWQTLGRAGVSRSPATVSIGLLSAEYEYRVGDRVYLGSRVAMSELRDNFSDLHRDRIVRQLRAAEFDGGRMQVWIDPGNPESATIDRRLPLAACTFMAFILLFPCGLATFVGLAALLQSVGRHRLAFPLWALLHGATAMPIVGLAERGDLAGGAGMVLGLLALIGVAGLASLLHRLIARPE